MCTFDCTGTLFEPVASIGALYKRALVAEAAKAGHGADAEAVEELALDSAFGEAYAEADASRPCFGAGMCTSEEWWRPVVEQTVIKAAQISPRCQSTARLEPLLPGAFEALFHETFVSRAGWRLRPHASEALEAISTWRRARRASVPDIKVVVLSNWDERLPLLLERLGVADHFDAVVTSRDVGFEKPSPRIFARAQELAGVGGGSRCVHVGDSWKRDVLGAASAGEGWEAIHVCSGVERARVEPTLLASIEHTHLESLAALPLLLGVPALPA